MGGNKVFQQYKNASNIAAFCQSYDKGPKKTMDRAIFKNTVAQAEKLLQDDRTYREEWDDQDALVAGNT